MLFLPFLREAGELGGRLGFSEAYRCCWYCWGVPLCCTAAEDMVSQSVLLGCYVQSLALVWLLARSSLTDKRLDRVDG